MVLTFIAGFAATFGAAEGVRAAQNKSRREEHRTRKNNLIVHCAKGSKYSALLEGRRVVLAGEKVTPHTHLRKGYRTTNAAASSISTPARSTTSPSATPSRATSSPTPPNPFPDSSQQ